MIPQLRTPNVTNPQTQNGLGVLSQLLAHYVGGISFDVIPVTYLRHPSRLIHVQKYETSRIHDPLSRIPRVLNMGIKS